MSHHTRRDFLTALGALGLTPAMSVLPRDVRAQATAVPVFAHGVASGDPLQDRVILWTKVTPKSLDAVVHGEWWIADDPAFSSVRGHGEFRTDITRDFTVKIDAQRLKPGQTYYYRFAALGERSPIGRTRTLAGVEAQALRFAFASCSNYPYGYFNAYARIAERHDLDFVLHLGDYIYEYALNDYFNPLLKGLRDVAPTNEIVSLADYRMRHAQYKSDPDLQAVHRQHPFICVWDDHEFANDANRLGAENHNPDAGEGDWNLRKRNAKRAYLEYMPVRIGMHKSSNESTLDRTSIYRTFSIGNLADVIMLDTRIHGRDPQIAFKSGDTDLPFDDPRVQDPKRTLLGFDQEKWLARELNRSRKRNAHWRVLGQQVMMAQLSRTRGTTLRNADQWDGYAPARTRLFDHLQSHGIRNNVVLTGDIHSSWCNDLTANPWDEKTYRPDSGVGVLGVEFITPAVSSPGPITDLDAAPKQAKQLTAASPHIKYLDFVERGYGLIDMTAERVQGEIYHVPTVDKRVGGERLAAAYRTEARRPGMQKADGPSPVRTARDPAP